MITLPVWPGLTAYGGEISVSYYECNKACPPCEIHIEGEPPAGTVGVYWAGGLIEVCDDQRCVQLAIDQACQESADAGDRYPRIRIEITRPAKTGAAA